MTDLFETLADYWQAIFFPKMTGNRKLNIFTRIISQIPKRGEEYIIDFQGIQIIS